MQQECVWSVCKRIWLQIDVTLYFGGIKLVLLGIKILVVFFFLLCFIWLGNGPEKESEKILFDLKLLVT